MADPLSIAASVIAVVGAAEGVGKTINKIRNIREAPNELLALINEISDLKIVLSDIGNHLTRNTSNLQVQEEQSQHMAILLDRAKEQLLRLDGLVQYRLVRPESTSQKVRISRQEWVKATSTIKKFRDSLRDNRLNIIAQMAVINASYQSRVGLMIDEIHTLASGLEATELRAGSEKTVQRLDEQSGLLNNIINNQSELRSFLQLHLPIGPQNSAGLATEHPPYSVTRIKATLSYQRFPCTSRCRCACHDSYCFNSPSSVCRAVGALFLGYSGYPLKFFRRCTQNNCQGRLGFRVSVIYIFPFWFLARLLAITFVKRLGNEIQVSLKVQRIVPAGAEVFRLTRLDDVAGLQRLFIKGLASPNDFEHQNRSHVLSYSISRGKWSACKFLLDAGADAYCEGLPIRRSPIDHAWNLIFEGSLDHASLETLRALFPINDDYLEERQFSKLHKIVLGLTSYNLANELTTCGSTIDVSDSEGYTPLTWAARRSDHRAVYLLLEAGASPNVRDTRKSSTPLMQAAASSSVECVRFLLQAGADLDCADAYGYSALHYAVEFSDSIEIIQHLISAGANVQARSAWGITPLAMAASKNGITAAKSLLDCGVNVDPLDSDGDTPLHESLHYCYNDMTELLLTRGASYTLPSSLGVSILHIAANSGGLRTLDILYAATLRDIDTEATDRRGKTALQLAQQRERKEEGFLEKFQALLIDIRARNLAQTQDANFSNGENANRSPLNQSNARPRERIHSASLYRIISTFYWSTLESIGDLHFNGPFRLSRPMWTSMLVYWVLGLGWAGLIYMIMGSGRTGREPK